MFVHFVELVHYYYRTALHMDSTNHRRLCGKVNNIGIKTKNKAFELIN